MTGKLTEQQKVEIRLLASQGHRRASLALEYSVSRSTIYFVLGRKPGRVGRPPRPITVCVICGRGPSSDRGVRRFSLRVAVNKSRTSRGAGSIELCEACWRRVAAPNRRPPRLKLTGPCTKTTNSAVPRAPLDA